MILSPNVKCSTAGSSSYATRPVSTKATVSVMRNNAGTLIFIISLLNDGSLIRENTIKHPDGSVKTNYEQKLVVVIWTQILCTGAVLRKKQLLTHTYIYIFIIIYTV